MKILFSIAIAALTTTACKVDLTDGDAFTGGGSQSKTYGPEGASNNATPATKKPVIKGKYLVRVALHPIADDEQSQVPTLEGLNASAKGCLCVGAVYLNINEDFSLAFPNSKAKCSLIGDLDLEKLLNGFGDKEPGPPPESDGKVLRLAKMGSMTFTPARPFLVGPIVQDTSKFQGYTETRSYHASYNDKQSGQTGEADGQITLNVLEAGSSLTPLFMPQSHFENIVRFEMLTTGFKGVPRSKGFLFDRAEFTLNSRPISIPRIRLQSKASDLIPASPAQSTTGGTTTGGAAAGGLGGLSNSPLVKLFTQFVTVNIQLDATSFETD
jgi:hypothetical protein